MALGEADLQKLCQLEHAKTLNLCGGGGGEGRSDHELEITESNCEPQPPDAS